MLGRSSTLRELVGLRCVCEQAVHLLQGRRVTFYMDSFAAIRNLVKQGGSKPFLSTVVRECWHFCSQNSILPRYTWLPREENTLADMASKRVAANLELRDGYFSQATLLDGWA